MGAEFGRVALSASCGRVMPAVPDDVPFGVAGMGTLFVTFQTARPPGWPDLLDAVHDPLALLPTCSSSSRN